MLRSTRVLTVLPAQSCIDGLTLIMSETRQLEDCLQLLIDLLGPPLRGMDPFGTSCTWSLLNTGRDGLILELDNFSIGWDGSATPSAVITDIGNCR